MQRLASSAVFMLALASACDQSHALSPELTGAGGSGAAGTSPVDASVPSGADASVERTVQDPPPLSPSCAASCTTPAGTAIMDFDSVAQAREALVGRWLVCAGQQAWAAVGAPKDVVGIDYAVDGRMSYLVAGPDGTLHGTGAPMTFDVSSLGNGVVQLNMHPTPNSGFFGSFRYSPCPRELELYVAYDSTPTILVAAPGWEQDRTGTAGMIVDDPPAKPVASTCAQLCEPALLPVTQAAALEDVAATLAGRWRFCTERETWQQLGAPADAVAIELGPATLPRWPMAIGGRLYYLVDGPNGPVRKLGFDHQIEYTLSSSAPQRFEFSVRARANGGASGRLAVNGCPGAMLLLGDVRSSLVKF
jgi:hypothetical protein